MALEVPRTVRVRLDVPDHRKRDLHAPNAKFQYCANRTAEWAWRYPTEACVTSNREAEAAIYDHLRDETNALRANLVQKAIKRATDDIATCVARLAAGETTSKPEYDTFSIVYDKRAATYSREKVSLATVNGRVECAYDLPAVPEGTPTAGTCCARTTPSRPAPSTTTARPTRSTCTRQWNATST